MTIVTDDSQDLAAGMCAWHRLGRFSATVAVVAAVLYGGVVLIGTFTRHNALLDRSPFGVVILGVFWLALALAVVVAVGSRWSVQDSVKLRLHLGRRSARSSMRSTVTGRLCKVVGPFMGLIVLLVVYSGAYQPGVIVGGDWGTWAFQPQANRLFPFPSIWSFGNLGSSNVAGSSSYMLESAAGFVGRLGISYGAAERILFYIPVLFVGYLGIYFLGRKLLGGYVLPVACAVGAMTSVPVLAFFIGGWFTLLAGAVALPWIILAVERYLEDPSLRHALEIGMILGLAGWYDPRNIYFDGIGGMVYVAVLVVGRWRRDTIRALFRPSTLVVPLVVVSLQLQWIIPLVSGLHSNIPSGYFAVSSAKTFSFNSLGDGLTGFNYAWPVLKTGVAQAIPALWVLVPLAVAITMLICPASRFVQAGVSMYLVYALLSAGAQPPFGSVYLDLFRWVPGVNLYRDTSVYLVPVGIMTALLIGILLRVLLSDVERLWPVRYVSIHRVTIAIVLGLALAVGFVAEFGSVMSTLKGNPRVLSGDLVASPVPTQNRNLNSYLSGHSPGSALWVPTTSPVALRGVPNHPNISAEYIGSQLNIPTPVGSFPAAWTGDSNLLKLAIRLYHIRYIVVRTNPLAYGVSSRVSVDRLETSLIDPLTRMLCRSGCSRFGSIQVSNTQIASAGVFSVVHAVSRHRSVSGVRSSRSVLPTRSSVLGPECLASEVFRQWGPVINGDNFARLSLAASRVSERIGLQGVARLTVASGAATMLEPLSKCGIGRQPSMWAIRVRYKNVNNDVFDAEVYADGISVGCILPSSAVWVTSSCFVVWSGGTGLHGSSSATPGFALSLLPANNVRTPFAKASKAFVMSVSVHNVDVTSVDNILGKYPIITTSDIGKAVISSPFADIEARLIGKVFDASHVYASSNWHAASMGPNSWILSGRKSATGSRVLVLWQEYNKGWTGTANHGRTKLRHVLVNGWANGYVIPPSRDRAHISVMVSFSGQSPLDIGMIVEFIVVCGLGVALVLGVVRRFA